MPPLHLRQEFPTLKAFKEALHAWAIESHFEPRILKSDTGRVRVGCKRDPNCPFVIRCNWERKNGREPLARVTVLRDRHTCVNAMDWRVGGNAMANGLGSNDGMGGHVPILGSHDGNHNGAPGMMGVANMVGGQNMAHGASGLGIREDDNGNIVGGARVLGPMSPRSVQQHAGQAVVPVLPKVQRNSASRLPFLMEILPRLMSITKETTPGEIREVLLKEFGAEVHLQQCRRAKTEILKKRAAEGGEAESSNNNQTQTGSGQGGGSIDGIGENEDAPADTTPQMFDGNISVNSVSNGHNGSMNGAGPGAEQEFQLHTASGVVIPQVPRRSEAALASVGESPVRCPYCVNHRWLRSIKDAVEHLSMHVVV